MHSHILEVLDSDPSCCLMQISSWKRLRTMLDIMYVSSVFKGLEEIISFYVRVQSHVYEEILMLMRSFWQDKDCFSECHTLDGRDD